MRGYRYSRRRLTQITLIFDYMKDNIYTIGKKGLVVVRG